MREYQEASTALPMSLSPVTPSPDLKSRVLAAATGQSAPRPAILTRLFWAAAAVILFSIVIGNLFQEDYHEAAAPGGKVLWKDRSVRLEVAGLPKLPPGKVYQLWHIGPEKTPVPARVFRLSARGELQGSDTMKHDIRSGHTFALTMEPDGGSATPTMPIHFAASVH